MAGTLRLGGLWPWRLREDDVVSEPLGLADGAASEVLGLPAFEVVVAEVAVELAGGEHVMDDLEQAVRDGDHGALVAAAAADAPVLGAEVAVRAGRAERRLHQRGAQPGAALVVRACLRLPALSLLPGLSPAHEDRWRLVAKRLRSTPISAPTTSAVRRCTPGIATSSSTAAWKGAIAAAIRSPTAAIASSR